MKRSGKLKGQKKEEEKEEKNRWNIPTTMSPTRPYSSHKMPSSNSSTKRSVCSRQWHVASPPSRFLADAVHLVMQFIIRKEKQKENLLRTPTLYDTGQKGLFGIVCNVRSKPINGVPIVAIGTKYNLGSCHAGLERLKNFCEGGMI